MTRRTTFRRPRTEIRLAKRSARRRATAALTELDSFLARTRAVVGPLRRAVQAGARSGARIAVLVMVASVFLASGAFAASQLYGQFGAPRVAVSERSWAERTVRYQPGTCAACHQAQAATASASRHSTVRCETCHGALDDHPGSEVVHVALAVPTGDVCVTCHAATLGRPARVAQVDRSEHYPNADCLGCHDPHAVTAAQPPVIAHPLANLPACTTCHNPVGLKKMPSGHELVADGICLTCHGTPEVRP